jgi:hypothetical protein
MIGNLGGVLMDRAVHRAHACLLTASLLVAATLAADRSPSVLQVREGTAPLFQYDAAQPLDVRSAARDARDGVTVSDITYASPKGGRVTAYLVTPSGPGPFAGLLFGHWGGGNRTEFLPEAILYAQALFDRAAWLREHLGIGPVWWPTVTGAR